MRTAVCFLALSATLGAPLAFAEPGEDDEPEIGVAPDNAAPMAQPDAPAAEPSAEAGQDGVASADDADLFLGEDAAEQMDAAQLAQDTIEQAQIASQVAAFAGRRPEALIPVKWQNASDRTPYVSMLVAQLKADYDTLAGGASLGDFYGSDVHPFLERGGAIRTAVPLPRTSAEFEDLMYFVLSSENKKNADKQRYSKTFFDDMQELNAGRNFAVSTRLNGVFLRDASFTNSVCGCPNLINLMTSILAQQADQDMFGEKARGRYGEKTYNRQRYGNAGPPKEPEQHMYHGFLYDAKTRLPVAVVGASTNEVPLKVPSVYIHYGFARGAARSPLNLINLRKDDPLKAYAAPKTAIVALQAIMIADAMDRAFSKKKLEAKDVILQAHTDKYRAAFMIVSMIEPGSKLSPKLRALAGREAMEKLWLNPGEEFYHQFEKNGTLPDSMVSVDASTVPVGDLGTEYPEPNNQLYKELYRIWRTEILPSRGVSQADLAKVPERLRNGEITAARLKEGLGKDYEEVSDVLFNFLSKSFFKERTETYFDPAKSRALGAPKIGPAIVKVQDRFFVADNFPMNRAELAEGYIERGFKRKEEVSPHQWDPRFDALLKDPLQRKKMAAALGEVVAEIAKEGNTGNQRFYGGDGKRVPTVAELASLIVGPLEASLVETGRLLLQGSYYPLEEQAEKRRQILQRKVFPSKL